MSRGATYGAASNQLRLLRMILNSYYGLHSFGEIIEKLEISEKTLSRYIKVFQEVFPEYIEVRRGREIGREPANERFLIFKRFELESRTGYQLAPLYLSRFFMSFLEGTLLDESLSDAVSLFESTVDMGASQKREGAFSQKFFAIGRGPKSYADHDDIIDSILQALMRQNPMLVEYRKPTAGAAAEYQLLPLTLAVYKQGLYLIAQKEDVPKEPPRFFAVERIKKAKIDRSTTFEYPRNYSPQELLSNSFGIYQGSLTEVELEFEADFARDYIAPRKWHPQQQLDFKDGVARLNLQVSGTEELLSWVLSFGGKVRVISPQSLKEDVRAELAQALERYE